MGKRETRRGALPLVLGGALVLAVSTAGPGHAQGADGVREYAWTTHLRAVDDALARRDLAGATRAWNQAYQAAVASWRWDGMLEVGSASLRIAELSGAHQVAAATARNSYLAALFRARQQDSVDGVLRAAEAFAALGDRDVVEQSLQLARALAAETRDPQAAARVRAFAARLATHSVQVGTLGP